MRVLRVNSISVSFRFSSGNYSNVVCDKKLFFKKADRVIHRLPRVDSKTRLEIFKIKVQTGNERIGLKITSHVCAVTQFVGMA